MSVSQGSEVEILRSLDLDQADLMISGAFTTPAIDLLVISGLKSILFR